MDESADAGAGGEAQNAGPQQRSRSGLTTIVVALMIFFGPAILPQLIGASGLDEQLLLIAVVVSAYAYVSWRSASAEPTAGGSGGTEDDDLEATFTDIMTAGGFTE